MKMTSWGCCVSVCDRSGEPVVHSTEPGLSRTDMSGSVFKVGAPTSEEEAQKKKSRCKRAPKSPLAAVLENWLLSILHCNFFVPISGSCPICFQVMLKRFREIPEMKMCLLAWRLMRSRGSVKLLLPGACYRLLGGGGSMMALRLSTVEVGAESCWGERLMMVKIVFQRGIH